MLEAAAGNALSPMGGQLSWRYDQCGRWRRSQPLPWTDVDYTSKFVTKTLWWQYSTAALRAR